MRQIIAIATILCAMLPLPAAAQWFAELGVGHQISGCMEDGWRGKYDPKTTPRLTVAVNCSENPLGLASAGYQWRSGFSLRWDHWSSLVNQDRGADIVSVRYRVEW